MRKDKDRYSFVGTDGNIYSFTFEAMWKITSEVSHKIEAIKEMRAQCVVSEGGGFATVMSLRSAKDIVEDFEEMVKALTGSKPYVQAEID